MRQKRAGLLFKAKKKNKLIIHQYETAALIGARDMRLPGFLTSIWSVETYFWF